MLELVIEQRIIKADASRIRAGVSVKDAIEPRPIDRCETHGARLTVGVDLTPRQVEMAETAAGGTNGRDLCMGRRVVSRCDFVYAFTDCFTITYHHCAERSAPPGSYVGLRKLDRA